MQELHFGFFEFGFEGLSELQSVVEVETQTVVFAVELFEGV